MPTPVSQLPEIHRELIDNWALERAERDRQQLEQAIAGYLSVQPSGTMRLVADFSDRNPPQAVIEAIKRLKKNGVIQRCGPRWCPTYRAIAPATGGTKPVF